MTKDEALNLALDFITESNRSSQFWLVPASNLNKTVTAIREALAQPEQEFTAHEEGEDGWSDWVCPDPQSYLMKCCDCGLVHEAQFGVVRYTDTAEKENCDMVDDSNLQAVFRMRRSEQWTPKDTAYRPGGLAQPEQEPVAWRWKERINNDFDSWVISASEPPPYAIEQQPLYTAPPPRQPEQAQPVALETVYETIIHWDEGGGKRSRRELARRIVDLYDAPPQRQPLTDEEIWDAYMEIAAEFDCNIADLVDFARAIERAHGIKEKA